MFDSMDLKATGVITFDEWLKFCREHIAAKTEAMELYWYMLEIFTEHDQEKTGFVKIDIFPSMMHSFLETPVKHGLETPSKDAYETLFKKYDPRNDGRLTVDEWMTLAREEVYKKFL